METLRQDNNVVVHKKPKKEKKSFPVDKVVIWTLFTVFMIYALSLIYPLIWGLISSFKNRLEYRREPFGLPEKWLFSNYREAIKKISDGGFTYFEMFWNSLWFTVGSCGISVFFTTAYSYVLNKYQFRGRNFLYNLCLFMIAVPISASFVSTYRLYYDLKLANSYAILFSATGVYGMGLIIQYSFWNNVSWSYAEAAQIDGANFYQIFFHAMMPQAMPIMLTQFLMSFISKWNDYMSPLLYLPEMPTLMVGLFRYRTIVERSGNYPILFAGLIMCMIPILIIFAFFQDKMMQNMTLGGLKG